MSPALIPALNAGVSSERTDYLEKAGLWDDFDAEAAKFTLGLLLHRAELLGVHERGVRIEAGQHAVDGIVDQVRVGDWIDVFAAHPLEHIAKQGEQPVGIGPVGVLGERGTDAQTTQETPCNQTGRRADRHTGKEGRYKHQGVTELPPSMVHTHDPLTRCRTNLRVGWHELHIIYSRAKASTSSDQLLQADGAKGLGPHLEGGAPASCGSARCLGEPDGLPESLRGSLWHPSWGRLSRRR